MKNFLTKTCIFLFITLWMQLAIASDGSPIGLLQSLSDQMIAQLKANQATLKTNPSLVYRLAEYRNQLSIVIPERTIKRPPTAELAPNQLDEDSLPPYPTLDKILALYINDGLSAEDIIAQGFEADIVTKVIKLLHLSEYKRRQAPIGGRINHKAFGRDWRYPVT